MTRDTSIAAYEKIKADGTLGETMLAVYRVLAYYADDAGMTQKEVAEQLKFEGSKRDTRSFTPRFAPMKRRGVINEIGKKTCAITGREALAYVVSDPELLRLRPFRAPLTVKFASIMATFHAGTSKGSATATWLNKRNDLKLDQHKVLQAVALAHYAAGVNVGSKAYVEGFNEAMSSLNSKLE
jgi:hypothetical protein